MTNLTDPELLQVIKKAAKNVSQQWPGVADADDLEQEICMRLLGTETYVEKLFQMTPTERYRAVAGIGHQLASQARTDYDHYKGSYKYSLQEVKALLAKGILVDPPAQFSAEALDLEAAIWDLAAGHHDALLRRYADMEIPSPGAQQVALVRALEALVKKMNNLHKRNFSERLDGPGTRGQVDKSDSYESAGDFDFGSWATNQGVGWG